MNSKARKYKPSTIRRLDTLSGNECASPECSRSLIARDNESIISKICHIEAASENGPRYNPNMTDDERRHFNNLILLCDECHTIIDNKENEENYPVSILREWKSNHESKRLNSLSANYSLLRLAIDAISSAEFDEAEDYNSSNPVAFNIEDKISHNAVKRNKTLLDEYKVYYTKINSLYAELEEQGSFKKENLLRNIRRLYVKTKGRYINDSPDPMAIIRENADNIIEDIEDCLIQSLENYPANMSEDISFGVSVIMVDAFMRCRILEEPPKT